MKNKIKKTNLTDEEKILLQEFETLREIQQYQLIKNQTTQTNPPVDKNNP